MLLEAGADPLDLDRVNPEEVVDAKPKVAVLRHQQYCKKPLSGRDSRGGGLTLNTTVIAFLPISTVLTSALMMSRWLSGVCKPSTYLANAEPVAPNPIE